MAHVGFRSDSADTASHTTGGGTSNAASVAPKADAASPVVERLFESVLALTGPGARGGGLPMVPTSVVRSAFVKASAISSGAFSVPDETAEEALKQADTDGDGKVWLPELRAALDSIAGAGGHSASSGGGDSDKKAAAMAVAAVTTIAAHLTQGVFAIAFDRLSSALGEGDAPVVSRSSAAAGPG